MALRSFPTDKEKLRPRLVTWLSWRPPAIFQHAPFRVESTLGVATSQVLFFLPAAAPGLVIKLSRA